MIKYDYYEKYILLYNNDIFVNIFKTFEFLCI